MVADLDPSEIPQFGWTPASAETKIDEAAIDLKEKIDATLRMICRVLENTKTVTNKSEVQKYYATRLMAAAQALTQENVSLPMGVVELRSVQNEFVSKYAPRLRKKYLHRLAINCIVIGIIGFVIAILLYPFGKISVLENYPDFTRIVQTGGFALFGNAVSIWFVSVLANQTVDWVALRFYDQSQLGPKTQISLVAGITFILGLLLYKQALILGVGSYSLNSINTDATVGLVIGLVCGISQDRVTKLIVNNLEPAERTRSCLCAGLFPRRTSGRERLPCNPSCTRAAASWHRAAGIRGTVGQRVTPDLAVLGQGRRH
jgi:hypothetical protein